MVQTAHQLNSVIRGTMANLLLEILEGEMGDLQQIPEPYHHLVSYTYRAN